MIVIYNIMLNLNSRFQNKKINRKKNKINRVYYL